MFGLLAAVFASVLFNLGAALQALEARVAPRELGLRAALLRRLAARPLWLLGFVLTLVGTAPQVLALALAPFVVVQIALASGLLLLLWLAAHELQERVGPVELAGVVALIGGIAFVAVGAPGHVEAHRGGLPVIAVVVALTLPGFLPWVLRDRPLVLVVAGGLAFAASNVAIKLASDDLGLRHWPNAAAWALVAGGTGILGLLTTTTAFQVLPATTVVPIGFAVQTFLPIALEPLFLRESVDVDAGFVLVCTGLVLAFAGSLLIARHQGVARLASG